MFSFLKLLPMSIAHGLEHLLQISKSWAQIPLGVLWILPFQNVFKAYYCKPIFIHGDFILQLTTDKLVCDD